jgi:O-antigen/teichoic acid export membrane protein
MAIGGLVCLSGAIVGAVLLVTHFLFGGAAAAIAAGSLAAVIVLLWYTLPLARLLRIRRRARA